MLVRNGSGERRALRSVVQVLFSAMKDLFLSILLLNTLIIVILVKQLFGKGIFKRARIIVTIRSKNWDVNILPKLQH